MPNFTKKAIKETFLKLLDQRPLNQITVKDIVEDCGINRNSFYYHFEDLHALLEEIIADNLRQIIEEHPTIDSLEEEFDTVVDYLRQRKRTVLHIYNSLSRDVFQRHLMEICRYVAETYINSVPAGQELNKADREVLIRYHKCVCFGVVIDWLGSGLKDDISAFVHRIYQMKIGWEPVRQED